MTLEDRSRCLALSAGQSVLLPLRTDPGGDAAQEEALHGVVISINPIAHKELGGGTEGLPRCLSSYMMSKLYMICDIGDARGLPSSNRQCEIGAIVCIQHPFPDSMVFYPRSVLYLSFVQSSSTLWQSFFVAYS